VVDAKYVPVPHLDFFRENFPQEHVESSEDYAQYQSLMDTKQKFNMKCSLIIGLEMRVRRMKTFVTLCQGLCHF